MNNFKIGDSVRATCDLSPNFQEGMVDVITNIIYRLGKTKLKFEEHPWMEYSAKHFEDISNPLLSVEEIDWINITPIFFNQNIRLIIQDKVVVLIDENGNKGLARCHPSDKFDFNVAIMAAVERLLDAQRKAAIEKLSDT